MSTGPLNTEAPSVTPTGVSSVGRLFAILVLAMLFFGFSLARSPIPGVNESHYLSKARHFWQPDWCRGDLFLESANPHGVFYVVFGWLTTKMSLAHAALVIRAGQSLLVAWGWLALGRRCLGDTLQTIVAAVLFLLLQATGTWSGEWLIGGAESKVWAYGFLFLAAAWGLDRRWLLAALSGGLAVSMHPVVGCWGVVIAVMAKVFERWSGPSLAEQVPSGSAYSRTTLPIILLALGVFAVASVPGMLFAVRSLAAPSPQVASEADYLQVAVRLSHHLDPLTFPVRAWRDYGLLLLILLLVRSMLPTQSTAQRWLERWMVAAVLIALAGVAIAWGPRPLNQLPWWQLRVKLLKLYPFRLADMLVPITVALTLSAGLWHVLSKRFSTTQRPALLTAIVGVVLFVAFRVPSLDKTLDQQPLAVQKDWLSACAWLRDHSPRDSVLYATNDNWSLRWYAERPEYFHFKDCPQDAASIVEWNRRNWLIYNWKLKVFADGVVTQPELSQLRSETGITHLVCGRFGPMKIEPVFRTTNVMVYELPTGN